MNAQEIYDELLNLHGANQWSFVPVRRTIAYIDESNVEAFWDIVYLGTEIAGQELVNDMARLGLCPMLANGEEHPLTLSDDGASYKYPDRASAFLHLMEGNRGAFVADPDASLEALEAMELEALERATRPDTV